MDKELGISQIILQNILKYFEISKIELSRRLKVDPSFISEMGNGNKALSRNTIVLLKSVFPELSSDWLITGEGEMLLHPPLGSETNVKLMGEAELREVPLVSLPAYASFITHFSDYPTLPLEKVPIAVMPSEKTKKIVIFEIEGDSMEPNIRQGDKAVTVELDKDDWLYIRTDKMYIIITNDMITIKYLEILENKGFRLKPINTFYPPFIVSYEKVIAIFKVEEIRRKT